MPQPKSDFRDIQLRFAAHIRDPKKNPAPPDIKEQRLDVYRGLLYRNIESFIANAFPVLRKLCTDNHWHSMVQDFFSTHQSHSPYFREISHEFLCYLQTERIVGAEDPPFLRELAHYEWIEAKLMVSDLEPNWSAINPAGDVLKARPVLSPLAWLLHYDFPVHRIGPQYQPAQPGAQPTFLLIYRTLDDVVKFMELNTLTAELIRALEKPSVQTGNDILQTIAQELPQLAPGIVMRGGAQTLIELRQADVILGTYY